MSAGAFSWPIAMRAMNAALCAYQIRAEGVRPSTQTPILRSVPGGNGAFFYDVAPAFQDAVGFVGPGDSYAPAFDATGPDLTDAALIGLTGDGYAILAFRGTLAPNFVRDDLVGWITDWLNDADAVQTPWPPDGHGRQESEAGFSRAVVALWPWVEATLEPLLDRAPKGLIVTGHSKGGAMTFLGAALARARWSAAALPIQVYAFAPPVTGNAAFAAAYHAAGLGAATHRVQVAKDLVPFLPRWDAADIWSKIRVSGIVDRLGWDALVDLVDRVTGSGYVAVGSDTLIADDTGTVLTGNAARDAALAGVVAAVEAETFAEIAAAHVGATSYLPKVAAAARING
ncbi:lipase family protein [Meridianimarinicoccus sp. RP-17]|uniref:lipase family protein n=1 Tax=Meridianimarinicoccus zhengii TaxID=2056810 RepID=UPI000DAC8EB0|nr:lipase family protein [Phycocomes zhengii]